MSGAHAAPRRALDFGPYDKDNERIATGEERSRNLPARRLPGVLRWITVPRPRRTHGPGRHRARPRQARGNSRAGSPIVVVATLPALPRPPVTGPPRVIGDVAARPARTWFHEPCPFAADSVILAAVR